jgi:hypothetical protein
MSLAELRPLMLTALRTLSEHGWLILPETASNLAVAALLM